MLLIATDLDRTLLPNGDAPESPAARPLFRQLAARDDILIAYVSGRDLGLVEQAIADYQLPQPDFIAADVGSSLYQRQQGHWLPLSHYPQTLLAGSPGWDTGVLRRTLAGLEGLALQQESRQSHCKLSYYLDLDSDEQRVLSAVSRRLNTTGVKTQLIYSIDHELQVGLLDVLPAGVSKLSAIRTLMKICDITAQHTLFCGDSGNDLEVLCSDIPAVLVANGDQPTRVAAQSGAAEQDTLARLYFATGTLEGLNGNYSAGIIEAVAHFYPAFTAELKLQRADH